jgi:hypothetical protein
MPDVMCLYLDDSGTRNPDHDPPEHQFRNWFGLGGILLNEEDEVVVRKLHAAFCTQWGITYPLHSNEIRTPSKRFSWLGTLSRNDRERSMASLSELMISVPAIGHAGVIDRPGYDARYRVKHVLLG